MDIPVLIVHYDKLPERKIYLIGALKDLGYNNVIFFEEEEEIDDNFLKKNIKIRKLNKFEKSCAIKHYKIYKYIVENNIEDALVLEDDAILNLNFKDYFEIILKQLKDNNYDICFIDNSMKWKINNNPFNNYEINENKNIYRFHTGKCACAYILSYNGARIFYENILPIYLPLDYMHNEIFKDNNMNIYWSYPDIIIHGSQNKYYESSIIRNKISFLDL